MHCPRLRMEQGIHGRQIFQILRRIIEVDCCCFDSVISPEKNFECVWTLFNSAWQHSVRMWLLPILITISLVFRLMAEQWGSVRFGSVRGRGWSLFFLWNAIRRNCSSLSIGNALVFTGITGEWEKPLGMRSMLAFSEPKLTRSLVAYPKYI